MKNFSRILTLFLGISLAFFILTFTLFKVLDNGKVKKENFDANKQNTIEDFISTKIDDTEKNVITSDTIIEYQIYHTKCKHIVRSFEQDKGEFLNMSEEQLKDYLSKFDSKHLIKFENNRVIIGITREYLCPNHYIIGIEDNKVAIFKVDKNGERELFQKLDQSVDLLGEFDKEKLKKGIVVDDFDKIGEVVENFIS